MDAPQPLAGREPATRREQKVSQRLLAVVTVVLVVGALKLSAPVTLPLACAIFLIAVFWPLQRRLEQAMPRAAAAILTLLIFLGVVALFVGSLWYIVESVAEKLPQYREQFTRLLEQAQSWGAQYGLSLPGTERLPAGGSDAAAGGGSPSRDTVLTALRRLFALLGGFVLVIAFLVLGLLEVRDFHKKLNHSLGPARGAAWLDPLHRITNDFLRYVAVRTGIGLVTGLLVGLFCWAIGLDFVFLWGFSTFLLNYIPTLGSVVAVVPPILFALVQFDGLERVLLAAAGVIGIQLVMGQYLDPLIQGKYLALSAFVVLFSVAFWGWIWGITGALLGMPLTVVLVIACRQFERTRWIAVLLADVKELEEKNP